MLKGFWIRIRVFKLNLENKTTISSSNLKAVKKQQKRIKDVAKKQTLMDNIFLFPLRYLWSKLPIFYQAWLINRPEGNHLEEGPYTTSV
mgnify:CR=1 FL=1